MKIWIRFCTAMSCVFAVCLLGWAVREYYASQQEILRQIEELEACVDAMDPRSLEKHRNLARWYNYRLEQGTPGLWSTYDEILDLGGGKMAVIEVPELGLKLPVSHGTGGLVGHDRDTAFPIGGRGRHTVLYLERRYGWSEGMRVSVQCLGRQQSYCVESVQVMGSGWSPAYPGVGGEDLLTLVYDGKKTGQLFAVFVAGR